MSDNWDEDTRDVTQTESAPESWTLSAAQLQRFVHYNIRIPLSMDDMARLVERLYWVEKWVGDES